MDRNFATSAPARTEKPGDMLRRMRSKLGITAREVEELSKAIAQQQGNEEFVISHGRIIQVENNESTPSVYKLCSLASIYGVPLNDLVSLFIDLDGLSNHNVKRDQTRLVRSEAERPARTLQFPVRMDPGFSFDRTSLVSRMVQAWGEVPVGLIQNMNMRSMKYGMIGMTDFTLYPLLKPGSFVQIDDTQRKVVTPPSSNEYNRPIYFIELRDGYLCGWCEMQKGQLLVIPHPLSSCKVRIFAHPSEAEIVGQVVGVAARIAPIREKANQAAAGTAGVPAQSSSST